MNKSLAKLLSSAVVLGSVFFSLQTTASPQDWQRIKRPIPATDGKANPIGSYSNGCIIGAEPLPYKGEGYQVIRMNKKSLLWSSGYDCLFTASWTKSEVSRLTNDVSWGYCYARWWSLFNGACKPLKWD